MFPALITALFLGLRHAILNFGRERVVLAEPQGPLEPRSRQSTLQEDWPASWPAPQDGPRYRCWMAVWLHYQAPQTPRSGPTRAHLAREGSVSSAAEGPTTWTRISCSSSRGAQVVSEQSKRLLGALGYREAARDRVIRHAQHSINLALVWVTFRLGHVGHVQSAFLQTSAAQRLLPSWERWDSVQPSEEANCSRACRRGCLSLSRQSLTTGTTGGKTQAGFRS